VFDLFGCCAQILLCFAQHRRIDGSERYVALPGDASPKRRRPSQWEWFSHGKEMKSDWRCSCEGAEELHDRSKRCFGER
jgi:hypothetical protein